MSDVEQLKDFAEKLEALQKEVKDLTAEVFRLKTQVETLQLSSQLKQEHKARFGRVRDDRDRDEEEDCWGPRYPDGSCVYR